MQPVELGISGAIASAILWALASVLIKTQVSQRDPVTLSALQSLFASLLFLGFLLVLGPRGVFFGLRLSSVVALILAAALGLVAANCLFLSSIRIAGVIQAFPLTCSYPLFTMLLAWAFLSETISWAMILGALLVVVGVTLLGRGEGDLPEAKTSSMQDSSTRGTVLALFSAACWGVATAVMKVGMGEADLFAAGATMAWSASGILTLWIIIRGRVSSFLGGFDFRSLAVVAGTGLLGASGLSNLLFLMAVHHAGAARASVLAATSPLFAALFAIFLLRERFSLKIGAGSLLVVVGSWLVSI